MEVSNVSRQLYEQQLPEASSTKTDGDFLIEDAFQKQLTLSEYYKGNTPYEVIKKEFMDLSSDESAPTGTPVKDLYTFPEVKDARNVSGFSEVVNEPSKTNNYYFFIIMAIVVAILVALIKMII